MKLAIKSAILGACGAVSLVILTSMSKILATGGQGFDASYILWMLFSSQMLADATQNPMKIDPNNLISAINPLYYLFSPLLIAAAVGYILGQILSTPQKAGGHPGLIKLNEQPQKASGGSQPTPKPGEYKPITGEETFLDDVASVETSSAD